LVKLYHQALTGIINGNNQDLRYNALWGNNGNTFAAEILEKMQEAAEAMGYVKVNDFDPKGKDADFNKDEYNFPYGQEVCFSSEQELLDAIKVLEEKVSEQFKAIKIDDDVNLDIKIPVQATLSCPAP